MPPIIYQRVAATITLLISLFGTISNFLVFCAAKKMHSMNGSFGVITKNQAITNIIMCLIFMFYMCPMQITNFHVLVYFSRFFGMFAMTVYEVSNHLHLLIAFNRLWAVISPARYHDLFSNFSTLIMIYFIWVVAVLTCIVLYELSGCHIIYNPSTWSLVFLPPQICETLTWYSDFVYNNSVICMTLIINLLTVYKVGKKNRNLISAAGIQMSKMQKEREMNFLKQTFFQGAIIFAGQFTYYMIPSFLESPIVLFLLTSLWAFMHAFEGAIILASNGEMKSLVFKKKSWDTNRSVKISAFGVTVNVHVLFVILKMDSMNNAFGIITINIVVGNIILCLLFLLYICPMQLLDSQFMVKHSHYIGTLAMIVYDVSNQSHLLIALNRFFAVFLSTYYSSVFSDQGTKLMIVVTSILSVTICTVLYEFMFCHFAYNDQSFTLGFKPSKKCNLISWYSDFVLNTLLMAITLFINLITAYKAGKISRRLISSTGMSLSKEQRRREMNFIRQCFSQGITIFTGQITYYLVAPLISNTILLCFVSSLWAFMHAVEGGVILASNQEMLKLITRKRMKKTTSVIVKSISK